MRKLLRIDSSANSQHSHSKALAEFFENKWLSQQPSGLIEKLDLAQDPVPHLTEQVIQAMYSPEKTPETQVVLQQSDQLITQLKTADELLLTVPMYNFGIPSTLKAYFDHVARVGETFQYGENGPQGLLKNKTVYIITTSGGDYTKPPYDQMNFVDGYLKTIFGFIGLTNLHFIHAPGMARGEELATQSLKAAEVNIQQILN